MNYITTDFNDNPEIKGRVKCQNVIFSLFFNFDLLPPMFVKICLTIMSKSEIVIFLSKSGGYASNVMCVTSYYCPGSRTCVSCKLLEHILYSQITL